ncbi:MULTISPECIES: hypothetical protein [unclassified Rhodococcus (in: high G+C Gram-positive bacteria)]|uniref:DUF7064 domain-containing protein n=1 Tax=unclassified Rhodococcus (in: high G+C Gram-positive bacteria) TaxID=192944 RepID=UPI00163956FF|nr:MULTISPECIES: hypothetical protein [unclassified Rhodococcus (in: high G+C Gram-positive bacteria)]MBC2637625.1 hypothetical protein [Rhodococcus sp. 3A]
MDTEPKEDFMLEQMDRLRHDIAGDFARESLAYCAILPGKGVYLLYTWVNGDDIAGYAFAIYGEGPEPTYFARREGIPAEGQNFDHWDIEDLSVRVGGDFSTATATYEDSEFSISIEFEAFHAPFDYDQNAGGCPRYQATNRYEQSGVIRGQLTRNGVTTVFDGPGHRDHSWGRRDWDAIHHYKWLSIVGADRAANIMVALVEGETIYNGYVFVDGVLSPIVSAEIATEYDDEYFQDAIVASVLDESGRTTQIDFPEQSARARWDISPTFNFTDTCMDGTLAGGAVSAYVQYTWPRSYLDHLLTREPYASITH